MLNGSQTCRRKWDVCVFVPVLYVHWLLNGVWVCYCTKIQWKQRQYVPDDEEQSNWMFLPSVNICISISAVCLCVSWVCVCVCLSIHQSPNPEETTSAEQCQILLRLRGLSEKLCLVIHHFYDGPKAEWAAPPLSQLSSQYKEAVSAHLVPSRQIAGQQRLNNKPSFLFLM